MNHSLENAARFSELLLLISSRVLAGVLPPAGYIFDKWHLLENVERFPIFVQVTLGVCSTTLDSIFNYLGEYFQLPWGVCSTTLGSMFNYLGEYFQLPWGEFQLSLGVFTS